MRVIQRGLFAAIILFAALNFTMPQSIAATAGTGSCLSTVTSSGTVTVIDNSATSGYCIFKFTSGSNDWTPPTAVNSIEYLVVAGGGAGGYGRAGGGGAGGVETGTLSVSAASIAITVGSGGTASSNTANNGGNSKLGTLPDAVGGGSGGHPWGNSPAPGSGGSGGGAGVYNGVSTGKFDGGTGTSGQGFAGGGSGNSYASLTGALGYDDVRNTGGGGGAGGPGVSGQGGTRGSTDQTDSGITPVRSPDGGPGIQSSITGTATWYAGGGGGARGRFASSGEYGLYYTAPLGQGGSGIGGNGASVAGTDCTAGATNTGSGGGGGGYTSSESAGCAGGSGIVIIRFIAPSTLGTPVITNNTIDQQGKVFLLGGTPVGSLTRYRQWQVSTDTGSTWSSVSGGSGATTDTYTTVSIVIGMNNYKYRLQITDSSTAISTSSYSSAVTLSINKATVANPISTSGSFKKTTTLAGATPLSISGLPAGTINWYWNGRLINGCRNISSSATCNWKPIAHGQVTISATFTPTDSASYNSSSVSKIATITKRTSAR